MSSLSKKVIVLLAISAILGGYFVTNSEAAFNKQIDYQAKVTNSSGVTIANGDYSAVFRLYTVATGGTNIWTETNTVTVTNGLFSVMLGNSTSLASIDFNQTLYLGVNFNSDGEMTPRKTLGAVPAAFESDKIDGLSSEQFLRSDATNSTTTASTFVTINQSGAGDILNLQGSGVSLFNFASNGRFGVGTTTPWGKLSVAGLSSETSPLFTVSSSTANSTTTVFQIDSQGHAFLGNSGGLPANDTQLVVNSSSTLAADYYGAQITANYTGSTNITDGYRGLLVTSKLTGSGNVTLRGMSTNARIDGTGNAVTAILYNTQTYLTGGGNITGNYINYNATLPSITSGTIGSAYGFRTDNLGSASVTNTYGVFISGQSGATSKNYNIYSDGDGSTNYFAGSIGIGTTTPWARLSVAGAADSTTPLFSVSSSTASATSTVFHINSNGLVGIGTTTPYTSLQIANSILPQLVLTDMTAAANKKHWYASSTSSNLEFGLVNDALSTITRYFQVTSSGGMTLYDGSGNSIPFTQGSGQVTVAPSGARFNITGDLSVSGIDDTYIPYSNVGLLSETDLRYISGTARYGFGTSTPNQKITVYAATSPALEFAGKFGLNVVSWVMGEDTTDGYKFKISSSTEISTNPRLTIDGAGNVGIGTSTPTWKLTVQGGICVTAGASCPSPEVSGGIAVDAAGNGETIQGDMFDIAERFRATHEMLAGEIAGLSEDGEGIVVQRAVAGNVLIGVVSTAPAISFNGTRLILAPTQEEISSRPLIALTGRVPVKINLEGGPIKKGDKITASTVAGVGRRAKFSEQAVGFALENWDGTQGQDRILVFVNLGQPRLQNVEGGNYEPLDFNDTELANVRAIRSSSGKWQIDENGVLTVQKLCIGNTCLTEEELQALKSSLNQAPPPPPPSQLTPPPDPLPEGEGEAEPTQIEQENPPPLEEPARTTGSDGGEGGGEVEASPSVIEEPDV